MKRTLLRRFFALAFSLVFTLTFIACTPADESTTADESTPTEQQIWLPYTYLDNTENCLKTYYYNEYGNEFKTTKEDLSGNLQATWLYEYDDNQNLTQRSVDTGDGTPFVQLINTYDEKGNLVEVREFSLNYDSVYTYQYNEKNRRISKTNSDGEVTEKYTYNSDGSYKVQSTRNADEYTLYRADGKIKELGLGTNMKVVYSYNEAGTLTECVSYINKSTTKTVYQLDENGNPSKVIEIFDSGEEKLLGEYVYKQYTVKVK